MKTTNIKRAFLFRHVLNKEWPHYTEVQTNVMIGICLMNEKYDRCSCNTLIDYLNKVHRTPYRKSLLSTIRKFKEDGIVRIYGKGAGTKIHLTTEGQLYLSRLEEKLKRVRSS